MKASSERDQGQRGTGEGGPRTAVIAWYAALAWVFAGCVAVQVFLAGMAVFVDPINWVRHVNFVHLFEAIPIIQLILAAVGRAPRGRGLYLGPVLLWILIAFQYAFADAGRTFIAALHPVNALVIFWLAVHVARRAWPVTLELRKVMDADATQA